VIGLDTNILVRWLVSPDQAGLASSDAELEQVERVVNAEGASLFINVVVIAETAWIMEKKLDLGRDVVSAIISRLLSPRTSHWATTLRCGRPSCSTHRRTLDSRIV
jgi:predicted nucleic-acid-binding protein